jgi:hypothetical protein
VNSVRPVYIEYDRSSAPLASYLHPDGMGYLFAPSDSLAASYDDSIYVSQAFATQEIETYRTWILWFQNRAEYFARIKNDTLAVKCLAIVDSLAVRASEL